METIKKKENLHKRIVKAALSVPISFISDKKKQEIEPLNPDEINPLEASKYEIKFQGSVYPEEIKENTIKQHEDGVTFDLKDEDNHKPWVVYEIRILIDREKGELIGKKIKFCRNFKTKKEAVVFKRARDKE